MDSNLVIMISNDEVMKCNKLIRVKTTNNSDGY